MAKAPAFQFYASDFLTDTQSWEVEEVGIYIRLLANEWVNGPLPNDEKRLARVAGCDYGDFKNRWVIVGFKFLENEQGLLYNERLEAYRTELEAKNLKNAQNGRKGGRPRKNNPDDNPKETQRLTEPEPNPKAKVNPNESTSSSSSLYYINKEEGAKEFFYINGELVMGRPSDRIREQHSYGTDVMMMNEFRGLEKQDVLDRLDQKYAGYQFETEMHVRNSFKTVGKEMLEEKKPKQAKFGKQTVPANNTPATLGAKPLGAVNHGG